MGVITTGNHPKALWPGVKSWFGANYNQHLVEYTDLFDEYSSTQNYEEDVELKGFALAPVKDEGSGTTYASQAQGYVERYVHIAYALGFIVTEEELDDNLYEKVARSRAAALARALRQTKENVGANIYNRGFNSSYTFGDGVELLATTHPSDAGNWSNELAVAADLSETSLEDLLIQIMNAKDTKGLTAKLMAQCLVIPTALWWEANRILKSTLQNDTANNAVNVLKSTNALPKGVKMNHYLTDTDAWFIRTDCPEGMKCYNRKIKDLEKDNDFTTGNALTKKYERYSFGNTDPRALYGSPGA